MVGSHLYSESCSDFKCFTSTSKVARILAATATVLVATVVVVVTRWVVARWVTAVKVVAFTGKFAIADILDSIGQVV